MAIYRDHLGPLLFLVYTNDLPNTASTRMFADDLNINYAASAIADLENVVTSELRELKICWFVANCLSLNVSKTELIGSN